MLWRDPHSGAIMHARAVDALGTVWPRDAAGAVWHKDLGIPGATALGTEVGQAQLLDASTAAEVVGDVFVSLKKAGESQWELYRTMALVQQNEFVFTLLVGHLSNSVRSARGSLVPRYGLPCFTTPAANLWLPCQTVLGTRFNAASAVLVQLPSSVVQLSLWTSYANPVEVNAASVGTPAALGVVQCVLRVCCCALVRPSRSYGGS